MLSSSQKAKVLEERVGPILEHLEDGWERSEGRALVQAFRKSDALGIAFFVNGAGDRLEVYGMQPRYSDGRPFVADDIVSPGITMSLEKSDHAIAGEIARRLIPRARETWDLALVRIEANERYERQRLENATRIARLLGDAPPQASSTLASMFGQYGMNRFQCRMPTATTFVLTIETASIDHAEQIVEAVEALGLPKGG